jgi:hypothetical protein
MLCKKTGWAKACVLVGLTVLMASLASAEIPKRINYQGRLIDPTTGDPLTGARNMTFRIFDGAIAGTLLWSETKVDTADATGIFSTVLGSDTPIDISFEAACWLEVEVNGETLTPRREIVSVPYAFHAAFSDSVGGKGDGHSLDAVDGDPVDVVFVDDAGRVGVGTTEPRSKFQVATDNGDLRLSIRPGHTHVATNAYWDGGWRNSVAGTGGSSLRMGLWNGDIPEAGFAFIASGDEPAGAGELFESWTRLMVIRKNGNVGIGTDYPGMKLDVRGSISTGVDGSGGNLVLAAIDSTFEGGEIIWNQADSEDIWVQDLLLDHMRFMTQSADDNQLEIFNGGDGTTGLFVEGSVGIGIADYDGYKLNVAGEAYASGGWSGPPSDLRFKQDIEGIEGALDRVLGLRGVVFRWRREEYEDKGFPEGKHLGVIAQEVEKVIPEVIDEGPDGAKLVAYTELIPVLIESIKELKAENDALKGRIEVLESSAD